MNPSPFNWVLFASLAIIGLVALVLALPLTTKLYRWGIAAGVLFAIVGSGLILTNADGIQVSTFRVRTAGQIQAIQFLEGLGWALVVGVAVGAALWVIVFLLSKGAMPQLRARFVEQFKIPIWKRVLIAFYSGVLEEIFFRLFFLSLIAWVIGLFWHTSQSRPTLSALWLSNFMAAVAFGLVHLPRWSTLTKLTPRLTSVLIGMNGIGGMAFGYLFLFHGIESAILAHFIGDCVLHIISPKSLST